MSVTSLIAAAYDFSVDHSTIKKGGILNIQEYLMTKDVQNKVQIY